MAATQKQGKRGEKRMGWGNWLRKWCRAKGRGLASSSVRVVRDMAPWRPVRDSFLKILKNLDCKFSNLSNSGDFVNKAAQCKM